MEYNVRIVCEHDGEWHYHYELQATVDENITCPDHPGSVIRDFAVQETIYDV